MRQSLGTQGTYLSNRLALLNLAEEDAEHRLDSMIRTVQTRIRLPSASVLRVLRGADGSSSTRVVDIFQNHVGLSWNRISIYGFRMFCTNRDLSSKKCVPCNSKDMRPMTEECANELLPKVADWTLVNEGGKMKLRRSWKAKSFIKGLEIFKLVADVAEAEEHHPDLHLVGWNNVNIEIWTHSLGGLTENDFILAAKINALDLHDFLRKKAAAQDSK